MKKGEGMKLVVNKLIWGRVTIKRRAKHPRPKGVGPRVMDRPGQKKRPPEMDKDAGGGETLRRKMGTCNGRSPKKSKT